MSLTTLRWDGSHKNIELFNSFTAALYISACRPLNLLILNAGVFSLPYTLTEDGYEATFQTNHLGHYYLTLCLLSLLKESGSARIVTVSAESHRYLTRLLGFGCPNSWKKHGIKSRPWKFYKRIMFQLSEYYHSLVTLVSD